MTPFLIAQDDALPLVQRAMRDQFQRGGSYGSFLLTFAGLATVVLLVYLLQRWYDRAHNVRDDVSHPTKMFRQVLGKLNLSSTSQQLLLNVAANSDLENPTAMLISCELFDRFTLAWQQAQPGKDPSQQIASIRRQLF